MFIRPATHTDLETLVSLRMRLFAETGEALTGEIADQVEQATREYFSKNLASALSRTWVVAVDGAVAAVGTLAFFTRPPYPGNLAGVEAYLLNMYTLPEFRRRGLAKAILTQAMAFAQEAGCGKVWLHASPAGRALYEEQGFRANDTYLEWLPETAHA